MSGKGITTADTPSALDVATEAEVSTGPARVRLQGERFAFLLAYHPEGFPPGLQAVADAVRAYSREAGTVLDFVLVAEVVQSYLQHRAVRA